MTILGVMRHAKSDWGQPGLADFDRPLNKRGRKAAEGVGRELNDRRVGFDRVIASPAVRVRETLERLQSGYGETLPVEFETRIYDASLATLFELVRTMPASIHAPLLIGHNPGLHQLVVALTSPDDSGLREKVEENLPTGALALIEFPAVRWDEVSKASGRMIELILPRQLED
jgi:phosphohistidine phosphatase